MAKRKQQTQSGRAEKADHPVVIGARVSELYKAMGMTQMELAWKSNLSVPKMNKVIKERQGMGASALLRLARTLNTSMDYLCGLTDDKRPR